MNTVSPHPGHSTATLASLAFHALSAGWLAVFSDFFRLLLLGITFDYLNNT